MTTPLRIATWNLMRAGAGGGRRTAALQAHMDAISPDVWVLTETYRDLRPGPDYALIAWSADAPDRDAARGECWTAVWSRLPATPIALTADPERTAAVRVIRSDAPPLVIVGTVLPWLTDTRYAPLRGGHAFCDVLGRQAAEWITVQQEHPDAAFCVAGDFNQDLAPAHYYGSAMGRAALERALADSGLVCLTAGACDPLAGVPGRASIDHLCVGARLLAHGAPRLYTWPAPPLERGRLTDHFGVVASFPSGAVRP